MVLGREDDVVHAVGSAVVAITDRDLDLAVRPEVVEGLVAPHLREVACEPVGQHDRKRHQLRGLVAGKAEHHPGVSRATDVDPLWDVRRLLIDADHDAAGRGGCAGLGTRVAGPANGLYTGAGWRERE